MLAAILADKLMKNHACSDGNKCTALLAADRFLKMNVYRLRPHSLEMQISNAYRLEDAQVATCTSVTTPHELVGIYQSLAVDIRSESQEIRRPLNRGTILRQPVSSSKARIDLSRLARYSSILATVMSPKS